MIRSRTVNTIHELASQGKSIQDIAITLGIARNTVRKYLRHPELVAMPHPRPNRRSKLDPFKEQVKQSTADITGELDKQKVVVGGIVREARRLTTKKGDPMCIVQLEDMYGSVTVTVFPKTYEETKELWEDDTVVIVRGTVQVRDGRDEAVILCDGAHKMKAVEQEMNRKQYQLWLTLKLSGEGDVAISNDIMKVQDMHRCLRECPGRDHYEILVDTGECKLRMTPGDDTTHYTPTLHARLEEILGKGRVEAVMVER